MASLRAPAALAAAPLSRTKIAPAPASPSYSSPLRSSGRLQDAVVGNSAVAISVRWRTSRLAFSDDEIEYAARTICGWSRYSVRANLSDAQECKFRSFRQA